MKRIIAALLALMLLSAGCMAEEEMSVLDQAKNIISAVNFIVKDNTGIEQLFVGYEEIVQDEILGFYTEDNSIQALLVANTDENNIDSCSFICDAPEILPLALNCASLLPFAQMIVYGEEDTVDAIREDMIAMAEWLDENHLDAMEAFENDSIFTASYLDSEFFHLDLMIVPTDEDSRMMAVYYFGAAEAEETAE